MKRPEGKLDSFVRYRNTSIIISIAIIAGFFLFFRGNLKESVYVETQKEALLLRTYTGDELQIPYNKIRKIEFYSVYEPGALKDGTDNVRIRSGKWENADWGEYRLFALKKIKSGIRIETEKETVVFNYESDSVTRELYRSLKRFLEGKTELKIEYSSDISDEE